MGMTPDAGAATGYPPQPWDLAGHAYVGVFLVPAREAPPVPAGVRPVRLLGRVVVGAAWVVYEEPSPLTYRELMATVLVHRGLRPHVAITHIWVDSPASRAGGRALWAIPKDLADFGVRRDAACTMSLAGAPVATLAVRRLVGLPLTARLRFGVVQDGAVRGDTGLVVSPVRVRSPLALARARWEHQPTGPLGFLAGRRPLLTVVARRFAMRLGRTVR